MHALFLDDVREPPKGWHLVRTAADFCIVVGREPVFDVMSLDHDLGDDLDGTYVADWLVRNMWKMPKRILIHSSNPAGAERMYKILQPHTAVYRIDYASLIRSHND